MSDMIHTHIIGSDIKHTDFKLTFQLVGGWDRIIFAALELAIPAELATCHVVF